MILAIDFDGTIVEDKIVPLRFKWEAKKYLDKLHEDGHTIIIWTCRNQQWVKKAKDFLNANDIYYDYFNEDCRTTIEKYGPSGPKVYADIYIDDRGILGIPSWDEIYKLINLKQKDYDSKRV